MKKVAIFLLIACARLATVYAEEAPRTATSSTEHASDVRPRCADVKSCEFLWAAARNWVIEHCAMKIRTLADGYLETFDAAPSDPRIQCRVTKDPRPEGGYSMAIVVGCGKESGCTPDAVEAVQAFNRDVQAAAPYRDWTVEFLDRLHSPNSEIRRHASEDLRGTGLRSATVYAAIAELVDHPPAGTPEGDPIDEINQHLETLASTGDSTYLPVLRRAATHRNRSLARHARGAIEDLNDAAGKPIIDAEKVRIITETQATGCTFIQQVTCKASECSDVVSESGANAVVLGHGELGLLKATLMARSYDCQSL